MHGRNRACMQASEKRARPQAHTRVRQHFGKANPTHSATAPRGHPPCSLFQEESKWMKSSDMARPFISKKITGSPSFAAPSLPASSSPLSPIFWDWAQGPWSGFKISVKARSAVKIPEAGWCCGKVALTLRSRSRSAGCPITNRPISKPRMSTSAWFKTDQRRCAYVVQDMRYLLSLSPCMKCYTHRPL